MEEDGVDLHDGTKIPGVEQLHQDAKGSVSLHRCRAQFCAVSNDFAINMSLGASRPSRPS